MLNTDAHSPNVRNRMTREEFVKNNRGINDGQDLNLSFLEDVYDNIRKKEIKLRDDPMKKLLVERSASNRPFRNKKNKELQRDLGAKEMAKKTEVFHIYDVV